MAFNDKKKVKEVIKNVADEPKIEEPVEDKSKEQPKERIIVVKEIPVQQVRETVSEEGEKIHLITIEEALSELINRGIN